MNAPIRCRPDRLAVLNESMRTIEAEIREAECRKAPDPQITAMRRKWFEVYDEWRGLRFGGSK